MGFIKDFKAFISKGNVVDMAVGVVVGGAFGKIVTSLVNDIVMPPIGVAIGGVDFAELKATIKPAETEIVEGVETVVKEAVTINWGNFVQTILEFLIIALCIFLVIRLITKAKDKLTKKEEAPAEEAAPEPAPEPEPTQTEVLLTEIRDLLKKE